MRSKASQVAACVAGIAVVAGFAARAMSMQVVMIDYTPPGGFPSQREAVSSANPDEMQPPVSPTGVPVSRTVRSTTLVPQSESTPVENESTQATPLRESLVLALLGLGALIIIRRRAN